MITDRVGDFIVRLNNAGAVRKPSVSLPYSAHLEAIAKKLKALGYVESVDVIANEKTPAKRTLDVVLAYDAQGVSKIHGVKRVSKPGRRLYAAGKDAHSVKNGVGVRVLSTPKGILSDREARKQQAGGETLFDIW
ncbi:MAG: 30S ribosomal protein S8 [bacterium]